MKDYRDKTVADIVTEDISKATVFKKYGIDFCCGGGKPVTAACEKKGIDPEVIFKELEMDTVASTATDDFNSWSLTKLADYIVFKHHNYIKEQTPIIKQFADKVAKVHGPSDESLVTLRDLFYEISNELIPHMQKEEMVLFPAVRQKELGETNFPFGDISGPIAMMEHEHDNAGELMFKIKDITNDFTPPDHACNTYKALFHSLSEYADDLFQHIHLENNILFKKAQSN